MDEALAAALVDANAMSLATANSAGDPSLRTVLLKAFSEDGFVFFTNLESTKSRQIAENPNVALLFYWRAFERQVTIAGTASRLPMADVARYFFSRPRDSRIAAWVSPQSRVIDARRMLEMKFDEMLKQFGDGEIPVPPFWGGFRVAPGSIEFWQGGANRLHDRFRYRPADNGWRIECRAPSLSQPQTRIHLVHGYGQGDASRLPGDRQGHGPRRGGANGRHPRRGRRQARQRHGVRITAGRRGWRWR